MKVIKCILLVLGFMTLAVVGGRSQMLSLAGEWRFHLDPEDKGLSESWFNTFLPDSIELPGSCEQRGFGIKNAVPDSNRLTRIIKYEGKAWYQRKIELASSWQGKRLELFLERCHWVSSVWLDGEPYGIQNSLSTPHLYDFGVISSRIHILTICVNNSYGKLPIGTWGFAISDDTQGNWNGIIGRIELRATDPVWIREVQVQPGHLQIKIGNITGKPQWARIESRRFTIPVSGALIDMPFKSNAPNWDEFSPRLNLLTLTLIAGRYKDKKSIFFGIRALTTRKGQFVLNGRPTLIRGPVNECIYPLTGYPPMEKEAWQRVLGICKSYGFNFMRFNSWCPPESAFQAADELGMFFQVELPFWSMDAPVFGQHPARDQFLGEELQKILENYGNHPSFAFMAMGNESPGPLEVLVKKGRNIDTRMLYRCQNGDTLSNGDYAERGTEIGQRGIKGSGTDWNRWTLLKGSDIDKYRLSPMPVLAHEVGQWASYPDFDQITKFTGTLRAYNYERFRNSLDKHNMADQNKAFVQASGKFAVSLYKEEIEGCLRTYPYGGFQIVEARDFPGEGGAIIGWLDAFWDSKGLITPGEFQRFCAPVVCLLSMPKRIYINEEEFNAKAMISNYGPKNIRSGSGWKIEDEKGNKIASGIFHIKELETGKVESLGDIQASLKEVLVSSRLIVTVNAAGVSNSWNIWVYPSSQPKTPGNVRVSYAFDESTREALAKGENVVLFSSPKQGLYEIESAFMGADVIRQFPPVSKGKSAIPGSYMPAFWDMRLFNQIGTLSILCDPKHPALAGFPTESYSDWQWGDLLGRFTAQTSYGIAGDSEQHEWEDKFDRSKSIILNETPADYRPIVQVIDNYERNYKLGLIFETRVGKGKLLICALDLTTDSEKRPSARQLKASLLNYASGDKFNPSHELPIDFLERILIF